MANPEHLQILERGVEAWNAWREHNEDMRPDLNKAGLFEADLTGANLAGADLTYAILTDTHLVGATLRRAYLIRAILTGADLTGADVSGVDLYETVFGNSNLTAVQGLEICHHRRPSTLDHRTLARSGPLPLAFLRGCGLNDWEIEVTKLYDQSLTSGQVTDILYRIHHLRTDPLIQFYSCFISYNHTEAAFARRLHEHLQDQGIRCWLDAHQMLPGDELYTAFRYQRRNFIRWMTSTRT
jgi:hypothetical protein